MRHPQFHLVWVRVGEVDCPEVDQPKAKEARRFAERLVYNKRVTVHITDPEVLRRSGYFMGTVASVRLPDGRDLGTELVRAGLAWHLKSFSDNETLARLEQDARSARRGIWSQPNPEPPWEHRASRPPMPQVPYPTQFSQITNLEATPIPEMGVVYAYGDRRTKLYYLPGCEALRSIPDRFLVDLFSLDEAERKGYRLARGCK